MSPLDLLNILSDLSDTALRAGLMLSMEARPCSRLALLAKTGIGGMADLPASILSTLYIFGRSVCDACTQCNAICKYRSTCKARPMVLILIHSLLSNITHPAIAETLTFSATQFAFPMS
eukprot:TRINITY_DN17193_c0_g4_i2.p1 TRINITY_DN17193_c0_g4~~TRINITY_DN17193_c0_g4_i2.p1  ORF type:complete len:119 (+),score=2.01 TRINITY_DN17193_c0_g4_i2:407-763(+)